jgi:hypothetical protein
MVFRKVLTLLTAVFLIATFLPASTQAVDLNKYKWPIDYNTEVTRNGPLLGYTFGIVDDFTQGPAAMEANSFISVSGALQPICNGFFDPQCIAEIDSRRGNWWSNIAFAQCKDKEEVAVCIEGVRIENLDGTFRDLTLKKVLPGNYWPANPSIALPEGSAPSLWIDPQEKDLTKGYLLSASGGLNTDSIGSKVSRVGVTSFQASISPYVQINSLGASGVSVATFDGIRRLQYGSPPHCIWADRDECGVHSEFSAGTRLQLIVHIPTSIGSWLQGRMRDPVISMERLPGSGVNEKDISRVLITADSVEVPLFSTKVDLAEVSTPMKTYYADTTNKLCNPTFDPCRKGYAGGNSASGYEAAFEGYELFKDYLPKNASIIFPRWSVRSLTSSVPLDQTCTREAYGKFQGLVTTNASIYQGTPPTFNGDSFTYKVAGVHNKPNGQTFQGSYDLVLESKFARCLYKFTSAPLRASVSITNADGEANIATSLFSEKDGWVKLSINGFTFSSPKINVKFEQDKVTEPIKPTLSPTASPTPTPLATTKPVSVQKTITCVKGKVTKKIKAVAPKCPAGYKKK